MTFMQMKFLYAAVCICVEKFQTTRLEAQTANICSLIVTSTTYKHGQMKVETWLQCGVHVSFKYVPC